MKRSRPTGTPGFIIIAALWIVAAVAALALSYAAFVTNTAFRLGGDGASRVEQQAAIRGAVELTVDRLLAGDTDAPAGAFAVKIGRADLTIDYQSEAARIDLNMASPQLLAGLMMAFGENPERAATQARRIVAWRSPVQTVGEDSENVAYRNKGLGYLPRHAPFTHPEELRLVMGIPDPILERILPFVTVYSGRSSINIVEAPDEVMAALPRITPERLAEILAARRSGQYAPNELLALAAASGEAASVEPSSAVRIRVAVAFGSQLSNSEVVALIADDGKDPYRLLYRRDIVSGLAQKSQAEDRK